MTTTPRLTEEQINSSIQDAIHYNYSENSESEEDGSEFNKLILDSTEDLLGAVDDSTVIEEHQEIPTNSETLLVREEVSRFKDAIWFERIGTKIVTLAGIGGIGSYVGLLLGRMHPAGLYLYDADIVEAANLSGQLYSNNDINATKVSALNNMINNYCNYGQIFCNEMRFTEESQATDIMICGFDNMEARKLFFNAWEDRLMSKPEEERGKCLFIDGRLAAEEYQVFAIQGNDLRAIREYRSKWLFSDAVADETICSYKQTTFMANMIASVMVNLFVNFVANECNPIIDRDVPFMTQYSADTMYFKVEM